MRVVVFGAAGATGKLIVQEALARGHHVVGFARDPSKIGASHERFTAFAGDANKSDDVERALAGADAAVQAIGSGSMGPSTVRTDTTRVLVAAMEKTGVKRLVAMSGFGAGETVKAIPIFIRVWLVPLVLKNLLKDQNGLEGAITPSSLDWTLVRPGQLDDVPKTGKPKPSLDGKGVSMKVPRGDVAAFIVEEIEARRFVRQAPSLGV